MAVAFTRDDALALDAVDPLARFRDELITPDGLVYLDGNSGDGPKRTREQLDAIFAEWSSDLIAGWDRWLGLPRQVGDRLGPLLGARPGEVIVHDSTTISIYQLVRAALALRPDGRLSPSIPPTSRPTAMSSKPLPEIGASRCDRDSTTSPALL